MATDARPDAELVTAWVAGDQAAFAAVYDRYADALFAFAQSRLRDRAAAADAVQDTFLRAAQRVEQLRDRTRLRAWLYAIARNQVIDAVRRPTTVTTSELDDMTADERDPADVAAAGEAAAVLRDAALGLNERDQELLDLHLRHGLDGADLADVAGLSRSQSYVAMNRLRARLAKAVGIVLVARHGSRDCAVLGDLLRGWDGRFTLDVRSRVTRHVEHCDTCAERRTALVAAVQLSPGILALPLVAAPALLRDTTLQRVAALDRATPPPAGTATPPPLGVWRRDGFPVAAGSGRRRRGVILVGAAALLIAVLVGVALSRRDDSGGAAVSSASPPISRPVATSAAAPSVAAPPASVASTSTTAAPVSTSSTSSTSSSTSTSSTTSTSPSTTSSTVAGSMPAAPGDDEPGFAPPGGGTDAPTTAPAPTTTVAPAAPSSLTTTTVPPPPPPPPGHIVVVSGPLTLGSSAGGGAVRIRNDGGQAIAWTAATGNGAFGVSPAGGSLGPGAEADVAVGVDRSGLAEGAHMTAVTVAAANGGGAVNVTATVERDPVITNFARTPPVVPNSNSCGSTLVSVSVTATDESPITSVAVQWSSDGSFAQLTSLSPSGGSYTGQVGSFSSLGAHSLKAIVTDARGNTTSQSTSVTVVPCP